jgi:hypothetical protein
MLEMNEMVQYRYYYWELPPDERAAVEPEIDEDETGLASDINWGRIMMEVPHPSDGTHPSGSSPDLMPRPALDRGAPYSYSDRAAAILQAAAYDGLDPRYICEAALYTQRACLSPRQLLGPPTALGRARELGVTVYLFDRSHGGHDTCVCVGNIPADRGQRDPRSDRPRDRRRDVQPLVHVHHRVRRPRLGSLRHR